MNGCIIMGNRHFYNFSEPISISTYYNRKLILILIIYSLDNKNVEEEHPTEKIIFVHFREGEGRKGQVH